MNAEIFQNSSIINSAKHLISVTFEGVNNLQQCKEGWNFVSVRLQCIALNERGLRYHCLLLFTGGRWRRPCTGYYRKADVLEIPTLVYVAVTCLCPWFPQSLLKTGLSS